MEFRNRRTVLYYLALNPVVYIKNYSVLLDIKLMFLTLKILLQPESTEGVDSSQTTAMKTQQAGSEQDKQGE